MKFKLPQLPNVNVPGTRTNRRGESMPPPRQPSTFETSLANFGNKSKEQMSNLFKKAKTSLASSKQPKPADCSSYDYDHLDDETTVLKRSNSDPNVAATLKSILKGRKASKKQPDAVRPDYRDYEDSSPPPQPPPHQKRTRPAPSDEAEMRAAAEMFNYDMPPRPTRRKASLTKHRDIPSHLEDAAAAAAPTGAADDPSKFPCPFVFETHDTFGDTDAFVEMLTQNILQESWESGSDKRPMQSGKGSSSSAPSTVKRSPNKKTDSSVGNPLMKALELQVEIETRLKKDKEERERRLKDVEKWQEELKAIKLPRPPDMTATKKQIMDRAPVKEVPFYAAISTATLNGDRHRRDPSPRKPATMPRHNTSEIVKPSVPCRRRNKTGGSCYSLPDWKRNKGSEADIVAVGTSFMKSRPLPAPPPTRPYSTAGACDERRPVNIEDVPPDVIATIVEISKAAILGDVEKLRERREGELTVDELKVKKLTIEELSAVRIIVNNLAARNTKGERASFNHVYTTTSSSGVEKHQHQNNHHHHHQQQQQQQQEEQSHQSSSHSNNNNNNSGGIGLGSNAPSTEDVSRGFETVSEMTATFESVPGGETTESSHMDTDLDCDSDLEGSIKSVEVAFDAIEGTLQTFKDTIASGPPTAH